jgi:hypothetical protein
MVFQSHPSHSKVKLIGTEKPGQLSALLAKDLVVKPICHLLQHGRRRTCISVESINHQENYPDGADRPGQHVCPPNNVIEGLLIVSIQPRGAWHSRGDDHESNRNQRPA